MGTEIYGRGFYVNRCYDHLNVTNPEIITEIHGQYLEAGAEILTTNTFGANRIHLNSFGLDGTLCDVIERGVRLARSVAGDHTFVAGSVGPISASLIEKYECTPDDIAEAYLEQIQQLLECDVDMIMLETFPSWEGLEQVYEQFQKTRSRIPCLVSLSAAAFEPSQGAHISSSPEAAEQLEAAGSKSQFAPETFAAHASEKWGHGADSAPVVGLNCGVGPPELLGYFNRFTEALPEGLLTSAMPNAGAPQYVDGRTLYMASPEYMAEYARRFVRRGAAIIGGCCGTTPKMIREIRSYLRQIQPGRIQVGAAAAEQEPEILEPVAIETRSIWGAKIGTKFAVSVELDPPKGLDVTKAVEGAKFLAEHGIDAVNIADGPRAAGRITPTTLAMKVREEAEIETIIHVCCRDRNILGLQMDLMSSYLTGMRNLMLVTGDPPKMGLYPDATAVFDMDSVGLVKFADLMNHGVDLGMRPIGGQTSFVIGVGCNPGAEDLDREVRHFENKVEAGAEYVFSQPLYDTSLLNEFIKRTDHIKPIPFFVGILPLASLRNAEFLTKNVPGMEVPEEICKRLAMASTKEAQRKEGIAIAAEALREAKQMPRVKGAYIFPPFGRYSAILDVLEQAG